MNSIPAIELLIKYLAAVVSIYGLTFFKSSERSIRFLTVLMICHFTFQFFAGWVLKAIGENQSYYKIVLLIYLIFTFCFFFYLNEKSVYRKIIIGIFTLGFLTIGYVYFDSFGNIYLLSKTILISNVVTIIASLTYFTTMLKDVSYKPLVKEWRFIIVVGFFFYSLVSSGSWMTAYIANALGLSFNPTRYFNNGIYIVELCIFFWGMWVYRAELKSIQKLKRKDYVVE